MMMYPSRQEFRRTILQGFVAEATVNRSDDLAVTIDTIRNHVGKPVRVFADTHDGLRLHVSLREAEV